MSIPSDGTFNSFLKSGNGILLIIIFVSIFAVTLLAALIPLLFVPGTWLWAEVESSGMEDRFQQEVDAASKANRELPENRDGLSDRELLNESATAYYSGLEDSEPIAHLQIYAIAVDVIVVEGSSDSALRKGPGHLEETPLPGQNGNFAVAGDRVLYGAPFRDLDKLTESDIISLTMPYGDFTYEVEETFRVRPDNTSVLASQPDKETITLITTDPPYDTAYRLIVSGRLVDARPSG